MFEYSEKKSSWGGYAFGAVALVLVVVAIVLVVQAAKSGGSSALDRPRDIVSVRSLPPPTPPPVTPPPTPPPQTEVKQQMLDQSPVSEPESKPLDHPQPASASLGTNIQGNGGSDAFGLGKSGNGFVGGGAGGSGGGSRFGWYATLVSRAVNDALGKNPITRTASYSVKVRIWSDANGRVTRAKLSGTSGDALVDDAIRKHVLANLQLPEPPPDGMPMPIVMRISERRPD
jgi:periplasmic protein TonB